MKRTVFFLSMMIALCGTSWAQLTPGYRYIDQLKEKQLSPAIQARETAIEAKETATRTVTCADDTLLYGEYKRTIQGYFPVDYRAGASFPDLILAGQWYPAPNDVIVKGAEFLASVNTETDYTVDVEVAVWAANADSLPTQQLASTIVTVDSGFLFRSAVFPNPVTIPAGNGYIVSLEATDPDSSVFFASNGITTQDGRSERNAIIGALQNGNFAVGKSTLLRFLFGPPPIDTFRYNVDMAIYPYVSYDLTVDFEGPEDCATQNEASMFSNASTELANSRYYNGFVAFQTFINSAAPNETFEWNMGDGSATFFESEDTAYTYNNGASSYDVSLVATWPGLAYRIINNTLVFTTLCEDSVTKTINSGNPATADFDADADTSLTVNFTDASLSSDSVVYAFGDGSISNEANPTHTYSGFGTFSVTQVAYSPCGNDTVSIQITITEPEIIGIRTLSAAEVQVFPNPSQGLFTVELAEPADMNLRVFNQVGQEIMRREANGRATLDLSGEQAGIYLLQGQVEDKRFTRRLIVK